MSGQPNSQPNHMDTSKQLKHVFGCQGKTFHLTAGYLLLRSRNPTKCPQCGADVYDASDTPIGQLYIAFTRIDLEPPS
jgi:hypothetical protein